MTKPIKKYNSGNFSVAIWLNQKDIEGSKINFKTLTLTKSWKDKEGTWRYENINLKRKDLSNVRILIEKTMQDLYLSEGGELND